MLFNTLYRTCFYKKAIFQPIFCFRGVCSKSGPLPLPFLHKDAWRNTVPSCFRVDTTGSFPINPNKSAHRRAPFRLNFSGQFLHQSVIRRLVSRSFLDGALLQPGQQEHAASSNRRFHASALYAAAAERGGHVQGLFTGETIQIGKAVTTDWGAVISFP